MKKKTVFQINKVFGSLLFTSDNLNEYSKEELQLYKTLFPFERSHIIQTTWKGPILFVQYTQGGSRYEMWTNFSWRSKKLAIKDSQGNKIQLKPHETRLNILV